MAAARQNEMNDSMTDVATMTFVARSRAIDRTSFVDT